MGGPFGARLGIRVLPVFPRALGGEAVPILCIMMGMMALQDLSSAGLDLQGQ